MSSTAKRFFNNNWDVPSFCSLNTVDKLLYKYIWERADIGGICQVNTTLMTVYLSSEVNLETISTFIDKINTNEEKLRMIGNDKIWIKSYARFQQKDSGGSLSPNTPPHKSTVTCLKKAGVFSEAVQNDPELFKNYESLTLSQPLPKLHSNSTGNSLGSGTSCSNGTGSSPFYQAKSISDMLDTREDETQHDLTKEVNTLINELRETPSINDPFNHIEYVISEMQEYYNKGDLTIEALREKLGLLDKSIK